MKSIAADVAAGLLVAWGAFLLVGVLAAALLYLLEALLQ